MTNNISSAVAERTGLPLKGVSAVIELLDEGATVPFISRYRKERTGSLRTAIRSWGGMMLTTSRSRPRDCPRLTALL